MHKKEKNCAYLIAVFLVGVVFGVVAGITIALDEVFGASLSSAVALIANLATIAAIIFAYIQYQSMRLSRREAESARDEELLLEQWREFIKLHLFFEAMNQRAGLETFMESREVYLSDLMHRIEELGLEIRYTKSIQLYDCLYSYAISRKDYNHSQTKADAKIVKQALLTKTKQEYTNVVSQFRSLKDFLLERASEKNIRLPGVGLPTRVEG